VEHEKVCYLYTLLVPFKRFCRPKRPTRLLYFCTLAELSDAHRALRFG